MILEDLEEELEKNRKAVEYSRTHTIYPMWEVNPAPHVLSSHQGFFVQFRICPRCFSFMEQEKVEGHIFRICTNCKMAVLID